MNTINMNTINITVGALAAIAAYAIVTLVRGKLTVQHPSNTEAKK